MKINNELKVVFCKKPRKNYRIIVSQLQINVYLQHKIYIDIKSNETNIY